MLGSASEGFSAGFDELGGDGSALEEDEETLRDLYERFLGFDFVEEIVTLVAVGRTVHNHGDCETEAMVLNLEGETVETHFTGCCCL